MARFKRQAGMALIMSLIMVIIISMIGISIAQQASSGRKNSAVYQDHTISFARATSGISEAEFVVRTEAYAANSRLTPNTPDSLVAAAFASDTWWQDDSHWVAANKMTLVKNAVDEALAGDPRYVIEYQNFVPINLTPTAGMQLGRHFYRITARAEGEGGAESYLQSYVAFMGEKQ